MRRIDIIKKYFIEYATYYIPPRACGRTLLKNKLIYSEVSNNMKKILTFIND